METWEEIVLGEVLRVCYTLKPWEPDMVRADKCGAPRASKSTIDEAFLDDLVAVACGLGRDRAGYHPLPFLMAAYGRAEAIGRVRPARLAVLRPPPSEDELGKLLELLCKWTVTYAALALSIPGIFVVSGEEGETTMRRAHSLLLDALSGADGSVVVSRSFWTALAQHLVAVGGDPERQERCEVASREVSIGGALGPVLARLMEWLGGEDGSGRKKMSLQEDSTIERPLEAARAVLGSRAVASWLSRSSLWAGGRNWSELEGLSGQDLEQSTFLGRVVGGVEVVGLWEGGEAGKLAGLGGSVQERVRACLSAGNIVRACALVDRGGEEGGVGGDAMVRARRAEVRKQAERGRAMHARLAAETLATLASRKGLKPRVWAWISAWVHAHRRRGSLQWVHTGAADTELASPGAMHALAQCMVELCSRRFLDPCSVEAGQIDLRILSAATPGGRGDGDGLFDSSEEARLNRDLVGAVDAGVERSVSAEESGYRGERHFVDQRNLARQRQFQAAQAKLAAEMAGEAGEEVDAGEVRVEAPEGAYAGVTELFALTLRVLHLGPGCSLQRLRQVRRAQTQLTRRREEARAGAGAGMAAALLFQMDAQCERLEREATYLEDGLCERSASRSRLRFYRLVAVTLLRALAAPEAVGRGSLGVEPSADNDLPLPTPRLPLPRLSPVLAGLPEHVVQDVADAIVGLRLALSAREWIQTDPAELREAVQLCVVLLASPQLVASPFVRHSLVTALHALLPRAGDRKRELDIATGAAKALPLEDLVVSESVAQRALCPALLRFFVDAEITGAHTQFYDKLNFRREVSDLVSACWRLESHRRAVRRFGRGDRLLQFASFLLNDLNFYIDEIESELVALHEGDEQSPHRGHAAMGVSGATHMLWLARLVAVECPTPFISSDVAPRLGMTLARLLWLLFGPGARAAGGVDTVQSRLPAGAPAELACLAGLWAAAADPAAPSLASAVGEQDRFFQPDTFQAAAASALACHIPHLEPLVHTAASALRILGEAATKARDERQELDDDDEDAPDEFLDALTFELMRDPVRLPSSNVVDRSTIRRQILENGEQDPFTREPLNLDDIQPLPELQARIQAYRDEKRQSAPKKPPTPEPQLAPEDTPEDELLATLALSLTKE